MRESTSTMVSVVVPIYNVSEYLVDCLESIKNQRHHNLEVILIDDGSTDDSGTICDTYASQDSRFRVIHQANAGLSAARNAGTAIASAPWLIYIDSDDIVSENYISDLLDAVISNNADSAVCRFTLVNEKDHHLSSEQARQSLMIVPPEMAVCELLSEKKASTSAWGKLAKTSLWLHNPFPDGRKFEDMPVTWKVLASSRKVVIIDSRLYGYRKRNNSISQNESASLQSIEDYHRSISQINNEIPDKLPTRIVLHALHFRSCLEYCRLLAMSNHVNSKSDNEANKLQAIVSDAKHYLRRFAGSALMDMHSPILQRARIAIIACLPKLASKLCR